MKICNHCSSKTTQNMWRGHVTCHGRWASFPLSIVFLTYPHTFSMLSSESFEQPTSAEQALAKLQQMNTWAQTSRWAEKYRMVRERVGNTRIYRCKIWKCRAKTVSTELPTHVDEEQTTHDTNNLLAIAADTHISMLIEPLPPLPQVLSSYSASHASSPLERRQVPML